MIKKLNYAQIRKEECLKFSEAAFSNGDTLLSSGYQIAETGNYPLATALVILGAEEHIKGIILYLHGNDIRAFDIKELGSAAQTSHKLRHDTAKLILTVGRAFIPISKFNLGTTFSGIISSPVKSIRQLSSKINAIIDMPDHIDWWDGAERLKERGFYVDYEDEILLPSEIGRQDYEFARKIVLSTLECWANLKARLHYEHADRKKLIAMLNLGIEIKATGRIPDLKKINKRIPK